MMFDFGEHADYMALGYAMMALLLGGMVLWTYFRYRVLMRESAELDRIEAEEQQERAAAAPRGSDEATPVRAGTVVSTSTAPKET
jgi:hypothetical protein